MHIYAFGSLCRGQVSRDSDIDLLALTDVFDNRFDPNKYSIYSYTKISEMWAKGHPFAWHLSLEAKLLFASDHIDFIATLGTPNNYTNGVSDCRKFQRVFEDACSSLLDSNTAEIFDLSSVFLSIRNIATCFALAALGKPIFSRDSALRLGPEFNLPVSQETYRILERARIICTRSVGSIPTQREIQHAIKDFSEIAKWMNRLVREVEK